MKRFIAGAVCAASLATASAADFFSTERSERIITFGARIGVNTSNRTISGSAYPNSYHHENWGTGFDLGVVANLNFRDYLTIQPGLFFEMRHGSQTLMGPDTDSGLSAYGTDCAQAGTRESYNLTIPVMAVVSFNVTDNLRWSVEAGPYVSFVLDSKLKTEYVVADGPVDDLMFNQKAANVDFGVKMGTGLQILDHYYVGAHYMAGCVDAWKERKIGNVSKTYGGLTKAWVFTIGYNF